MGKRLLFNNKDGVYHVVCRTAYQSHKLSNESKAMFVELLHKQARFSGVEVITYCLLENHVHLLVKVPYHKTISDSEIVERYRSLYGEEGSEYVMPAAMVTKLLKADDKRAKSLRRQLMARMQNLSIFVKELKQRFGIWFNRRYQNEGTLWSDRFHSILVENKPAVIALVAAYIDLNPVRLKLCKQPEDYPFSYFKQNKYYHLMKLGSLSKAVVGSKNASPESANELSKSLQNTIRAMSHGKLIGSHHFVEGWKQQHQGSLKGKSKWVSASLENALHFCLSLTELHHYRKWAS